MANGVITWNGVASDTLGIIVRKVPSLNRPQRKYNSYSVPGRNGDIVVMQDAYADYEQEYEIFALDDAQIDASAIADWLYQDGWCKLSDDWEPDYYRMAYFVGPVDIEPIMDEAAVCTVTFRCRPQRYLSQGTNQMAKMTTGTYSANGATVVVDANGKATLSGTTTSGGSIAIIPLENSITITQDMVDNDTYLYLNNYGLNTDTIIYFEDNSSVKAVTAYAPESNSSVKIPQSAAGKTITRVKIYLANNRTASGTFMPKLQSESSVISVTNGDTVINPTNHIALPIITLTGNQIIPNLLDLETPYGWTYDSSSTIWLDQFLDNIEFNHISRLSDQSINVGTYTQANASSRGGTLTAHVNSTGTLTFTPFRTSGDDVGISRGVTLTPNTDYTISCTTTSGNSKIEIYFFNSESPKKISSKAEASRSGAGTLTLSFHTPVTCENVLIHFLRTDNTAGTFSSIMLNTGTTAETFVAYGGGASATFTINDTTLAFTHMGFSTAVIDCEKENFTIDGVVANNKARVLDQHGNLSDEYLQLKQGDNVVTFNSGVSSASFDPRFWEL